MRCFWYSPPRSMTRTSTFVATMNSSRSPATPLAKKVNIHGTSKLGCTFARFLVSGGINTAATYALYWMLLHSVHYQVAYAISYVVGIAVSYVLNLKFVFTSRHSNKKAVIFPLVYLLNYVCGAIAVHIIVKVAGWSASIAPLAAIALTIPITFLLTRKVLNE